MLFSPVPTIILLLGCAGLVSSSQPSGHHLPVSSPAPERMRDGQRPLQNSDEVGTELMTKLHLGEKVENKIIKVDDLKSKEDVEGKPKTNSTRSKDTEGSTSSITQEEEELQTLSKC